MCIAALAKLGYTVLRQKGSHVRLVCPKHPPVTVPLHHEIDRGTLRSAGLGPRTRGQPCRCLAGDGLAARLAGIGKYPRTGIAESTLGRGSEG